MSFRVSTLQRTLIGLLLILCASNAQGEDFVFHHEHILGTSLEIRVTADTPDQASAAEEQILREIERQNRIFSSYSADSELARWQQSVGKSQPVSPELLAMMQACDVWQQQSGGAFNPAAEVLTKVWNEAAERNQLPTKAELVAAVRRAGEHHWSLDAATQTAKPLTGAPLSFNAIAKGFIVEAACQAALKADSELQGLVVNLGGDLRVCGDAVQRIAIADPLNAADNAQPIATIHVHNRAVATSGNYRRGWQIGGRWYSHILDPRNGRPVERIVSATVIAQSSADVDALATICNVLPPHESLALVEAQGAACLLITRDGKQHASAGWEQFKPPRLHRFAAAMADENDLLAQAGEKKATPELLELEVKVELSRPPGAQYRRPYVAVWLEDADEKPVRTGLLLLMTKQPGPRWHRELLRWYKQDNVRKLADDRNLIDTISSASRGPGEYRAVFDGLDDNGQPLKPGKYMLFIEVNREHGTYQIIRQPLELGAKPIETTQLKSNVEVKSASFEYRQPAAKKQPN